jgi:origin recognition complex subunit 1
MGWQVARQHRVYAGVLPDEATRAPGDADLALVRDALAAARALLLEDRGARRCVLNLEQGEVERVLGEVGGQRWKAALAQ